MTPAGLEPAIPGSVGRCLIHWATGPLMRSACRPPDTQGLKTSECRRRSVRGTTYRSEGLYSRCSIKATTEINMFSKVSPPPYTMSKKSSKPGRPPPQKADALSTLGHGAVDAGRQTRKVSKHLRVEDDHFHAGPRAFTYGCVSTRPTLDDHCLERCLAGGREWGHTTSAQLEEPVPHMRAVPSSTRYGAWETS